MSEPLKMNGTTYFARLTVEHDHLANKATAKTVESMHCCALLLLTRKRYKAHKNAKSQPARKDTRYTYYMYQQFMIGFSGSKQLPTIKIDSDDM